MDTSLSVLGLNYAQLITDFMFHRTPVVAVVFMAATILSVWSLVQTGSYRSLITLGLIALAVILLVLPQRQEKPIRGQALKDTLLDFHSVPTLLSFAAEISDSLNIGIIHTIDAMTPAWARYLPRPFSVHKSALYIREELRLGVEDPQVHDQLRKFLHDDYVPALTMFKRDVPGADLSAMWPGHAQITAYYSADAKNRWTDIKQKLIHYFTTEPALSDDALSNISLMTQSTFELVQESVIRVLVQRELQTTEQGKGSVAWPAIVKVLIAFPFIYGYGNLVLYAVFPFFILALVVTRSISVLVHYLKTFVWIKSWMLGGALSSYVSLFMARAQQEVSTGPSWAWEYPYYTAAAAAMLLVVPIVTFVLINHRRV